MKKILLITLIALVFFFNDLYAQTGSWAFMNGDSVSYGNGIFGIQGISSPLNHPPGMYEPCEWTDANGNFWLFGSDTYNALWKFEPLTNQWTWITGAASPGQYGSYGTQGISSPFNHPGGRAAATSWTDQQGNLWLFGGYGYGSGGFQGGLNDLWKYNITINEWTWISGSTLPNQTGVYGMIGIPDPANIPPARLETAAAWADDSGNLWFFGGQLCCTAYGFIDDLWKYNITTDEWTWMKGSNVCCSVPVYGTQGIPDASNTPGGRRIYSHWKDHDNNFWIFGGQDNTQNCFNDLWKYEPASNEWIWMNGSSSSNSNGNFETQCEFDSLSEPPSRMENRFYWTDSCDNFWMFGGLNTINGISRNDLWCYQPSVNKWKWVSGSSGGGQIGHYGIQGVADPANHPGARYGGVGWMGAAESLWLFGGVGLANNNSNFGNLNDLWRFIPDTGCIFCNVLLQPVSQLQSSDSSVCEKFCIDFLDLSSNSPLSWQWQFPGGSPSSSTDQNPINICYNNPGIFDVILITTNTYGSDTLTLQNFINVNSTPSIPLITQNGYTLTSTSATTYQWQYNSIDIPGATNQSYVVTQSGYYTVVITDEHGCISSSSNLYLLITDVDEIFSENNLLIYPNPSDGNFMVEVLNGLLVGTVSIQVMNTLGEIVFSSEEKMVSDHFSKTISLSNSSAGIYLIEIATDKISVRKKFLISQ